MYIQVFFIEAQAGVSFQFYDDAGALLGVPVSVGVEALPQVGAYGAEATVPVSAVGVIWTCDDVAVTASEDLREALKAAGSGATPVEVADEIVSRADQILLADAYVPSGAPVVVIPAAPDEADLCAVYFYTESFSGVETQGVAVTFTIATATKADKVLRLSAQSVVSDGAGFGLLNLKKTDVMIPAGSSYLVNSPELGLRDVAMTLTTDVYNLADLVTG